MRFLLRKQLCCVILSIIFLIFLYNKFFLDFDGELIKSIDSIVKNNKLFHGVIVLSKNRQIIYRKSYPDDSIGEQQFPVASITKQFTGALILREVGKKNITLSKSANVYLKNHQKINEKITVHHLLSHTSGIIDSEKFNSNLKFKPGGGYKYSNNAYVILGYILENATGRGYADLASELLRQADMSDSFFIDDISIGEARKKHPRLSPSFTLVNGEYSEVFEVSERKFNVNGTKKIFFTNPCGGLISTAADLTAWNYALHTGKILSEKIYKQMIFPMVKSDFPEGFYGYGVCRPSDHEISHIGYASGYKSTLSYFPKYQISLVILENTAIGNYELDFQMHKNIRNIICHWLNNF